MLLHAYTALQSHHLGNAAWREKHQHALMSLAHFHVRTGALVPGSGMQYSARHGVPYMFYRGREVQTPDALQLLGHALA